ncbi:MAG: hypothetical protein MRZ79_06680 [Bacteroidia bacterium]|nr:hypothetical protein [Bacteroidia bacterium]
MRKSFLSKDNILSRVSSYDILNHYLKPYHRFERLKKGQLISNPFIYPDKQQTPSFNIYPGKTGEWYFKDFATGDYGSAVDLVMQLQIAPFYEALQIINKDFNLGLTAENFKKS